ncbi:MAG: hypothetical protein JWO71_1146 [Candidatus Acidoferrum typicum]|nr:hypothetical protein [Candidatus Acidoferrum typicum]
MTDNNLNLLSGDLIEVRSREEILSTLDSNGRLEAMPFMPEMLQYCGKRFRVSKRADKTCDNIKDWSLRRVKNAVHLTGVRCDGASHGDCDAGCLIFWNEKWLKRADTDFLKTSQIQDQAPRSLPSQHPAPAESLSCTEQRLNQAIFHPDPSGTDTPVYTCQATQLREFTSTLYWWDLRQYLRDIRSGNLRREFGDSKSERLLETILGVIEVFRALVITTFNKVQQFRSGVQYPHIGGSLNSTTTGPELKLQPGEFVQVRSKDEILSTLDRRNKNRGLLFDSEMLRYCGGSFRVLKRVNQIVDERTGKMMKMKSPCIILEGVACASDYHRFCPRAIYHYWRETWLRRVDS